MPATIEELFRTESRRVLATLIRLLDDFDLAEEALQDAFAAAVEHWPAEGVPKNPRAWLVSTGRFKAIDGLRRRARFDASLSSVAERLGDSITPPHEVDDEKVEDDRLRLTYTTVWSYINADQSKAPAFSPWRARHEDTGFPSPSPRRAGRDHPRAPGCG